MRSIINSRGQKRRAPPHYTGVWRFVYSQGRHVVVLDTSSYQMWRKRLSKAYKVESQGLPLSPRCPQQWHASRDVGTFNKRDWCYMAKWAAIELKWILFAAILSWGAGSLSTARVKANEIIHIGNICSPQRTWTSHPFLEADRCWRLLLHDVMGSFFLCVD